MARRNQIQSNQADRLTSVLPPCGRIALQALVEVLVLAFRTALESSNHLIWGRIHSDHHP